MVYLGIPEVQTAQFFLREFPDRVFRANPENRACAVLPLRINGASMGGLRFKLLIRDL
jgi:hypothetical protein